MPSPVFVDTSAWVALSDKDETHHQEARLILGQVLRTPTTLITTCLVAAEAHVILRRRLGHRVAMAFIEGLNTSPRVEIVYPDNQVEVQAKHILRQYQDQDFSLTDAVSFVVMRERGLTDAFSFDHHFLTAGFSLCSA